MCLASSLCTHQSLAKGHKIRQNCNTVQADRPDTKWLRVQLLKIPAAVPGFIHVQQPLCSRQGLYGEPNYGPFRSHQHSHRHSVWFMQPLFMWNSTSDHLIAKKQTDLVVLDFLKTFDKVPHHRLRSKLQYYGIQGSTLRWITSFLHERQQRVLVDGMFHRFYKLL